MLESGVQISINLPVMTKPTQFDSMLNFVNETNSRFSSQNVKIISFMGMHPNCQDIPSKMKKIKESGILGVKIHPDYQSTYIDDDGYIEILKCAKDNDLIVVTHSGIDDGYKNFPERCPPELVKRVIDVVGHSKFVLGHYGAHKQWEETLNILAGKDVFFDTAVTLPKISEELFVKIAEKHGYDKILFATDSPWGDAREDVLKLKSFNISEENLQKILYKNALKLLGL